MGIFTYRCKYLHLYVNIPHDEIKRYIVGPVGTKVVVVFASIRDKGITTQLDIYIEVLYILMSFL
jgi:hypothetical protein